jgi:hypothetical protein
MKILSARAGNKSASQEFISLIQIQEKIQLLELGTFMIWFIGS